MKTANALSTFHGYLRSQGLDIGTLTAPAAINAMLGFYADLRAVDTDLDADGDMLLFQCGTHSFSEHSPSFQYDITRQLIIRPGDDDEDVWQLSLTLHYPPGPDNTQLRASRWNPRPSSLPEFAAFIDTHPATAYATKHRPDRIDLDWSGV